MAYVFMMGNCIACNNPFSFNPMKVPSLRVNGVREPLCKECVAEANRLRVERGDKPVVIHPDAYDPCDENEVDWNGGE